MNTRHKQSLEPEALANLDQIRVGLADFDCESVARSLEHVLERNTGVVHATVDPTTNSAFITYDRRRAPLDSMLQTVENFGFRRTTVSMRVAMNGLASNARASEVERALLSLPGVLSASASIKAGQVLVTFFPETADVRQIRMRMRSVSEETAVALGSAAATDRELNLVIQEVGREMV